MKYKTLILVMILIVLIIPLISAQNIVTKVGEERNLLVICTNNGTFCSNNTVANVSITAPDGSIIANNQPLSKNGDGSIWNYTLNTSQTSQEGEYLFVPSFNDNATTFSDSLIFIVTATGTEMTSAKSIMYLGLLIIASLLVVLCLVGGFSINGKNEFTMGGDILTINWNKYLKILLFFFAYIFLVALSWLAWEISDKFLTLPIGNVLFEWVFYILIALFLPVFIAFIVISITKWLMDIRLDKLMERNLKPRGGKKR